MSTIRRNQLVDGTRTDRLLFQKSTRGYTNVATQFVSNFQPLKHPKLTVQALTQCIEENAANEVPPTVVIPSPPKQFNLFKKYEAMAESDVCEVNGQYIGQYTEVFKCPQEREMAEYIESKKKFVGGPFRSAFGAASQLPLRKEGLIQGPFPDHPGPGICLPPRDWSIVLNR